MGDAIYKSWNNGINYCKGEGQKVHPGHVKFEIRHFDAESLMNSELITLKFKQRLRNYLSESQGHLKAKHWERNLRRVWRKRSWEVLAGQEDLLLSMLGRFWKRAEQETVRKKQRRVRFWSQEKNLLSQQLVRCQQPTSLWENPVQGTNRILWRIQPKSVLMANSHSASILKYHQPKPFKRRRGKIKPNKRFLESLKSS